MSHVAFQGERRIADLVTRVYGKLSAAAAKRAAAALLAANPELERLDLVERGRPIFVPMVPGRSPLREADRSAPPIEGMDGLRASVTGFVRQLGDGVKLERRDLEQARSLIESDDLRDVVDDNAEAGELIERISEELARRAADLEGRTAFARRLRKLEKELAELGELLG